MVSPVTGSISGPAYDFSISLVLVAVLFIAGRHPIFAPFIATGLYILVPAYVTSATVQRYVPVAFGATAVVAAMLPSLELSGRFQASTKLRERVGRSPVGARGRQFEEARA
jgi:ABC-type branched-subunit amino acid transport system permease subunit